MIYERVIQEIEVWRENILRGDINCIPCPFTRFSDTFPGIEQKKYYIVTANSKVGKTQLADYIFMYHPLLYAFNNRNKVKIKIFYFTLEMTKEEKYRQFMCHLLFILSRGKIRYDTKNLRSLKSALPESILALLKSPQYREYYEFFENNIVFIDSIRNPSGIYTYCEQYALNKGTMHMKNVSYTTKEGTVVNQSIRDYYTPDDESEYRMIFVDHYKLLSSEKGKSTFETIGDFSSKCAVSLRNDYGYTIVGIQQQASSQESNDNLKLNKLRPTLDGLGENKSTQQDADIILGLYSPYRYGIPDVEGYDITLFRDNIRFLEILSGREGGGGNICPLYFDGAVNYFKELPKATDTAQINQIIAMIRRMRESVTTTELASLLSIIKIKTKTNARRNFWNVWRWKNHKYSS